MSNYIKMAAFMIVFYDEDTDLDLVNTYEITRYDQYLNCIRFS